MRLADNKPVPRPHRLWRARTLVLAYVVCMGGCATVDSEEIRSAWEPEMNALGTPVDKAYRSCRYTAYHVAVGDEAQEKRINDCMRELGFRPTGR